MPILEPKDHAYRDRAIIITIHYLIANEHYHHMKIRLHHIPPFNRGATYIPAPPSILVSL